MSLADHVFSERWRDLRGHSTEDAMVRDRLEGELVREVASGHELYGREANVVAACSHCDDCLFVLDDGAMVVVHLSYPTEPGSTVVIGWGG